MNLTLIQETAKDFETLFKATIELYESYFKALEAVIQQTPTTEVGKLTQLNALAKEAEEAMEADLALFYKAISTDTETTLRLKEELKIQSIHKKLQQ